MGLRGPKPKGKVELKWSSGLAYSIGLIVTDGGLSGNGRTINLTSKDFEQIENFLTALNIKSNIGKKSSGFNKEKKYFVVQIGDILFYRFLLSIGLMPKKTKIVGKVDIPEKYFLDFLRGHLDGDGSTYSYFDPRWKSSYMFYTQFCSASPKHIEWLQSEIFDQLGIKGHISKSKNSTIHQLRFAKKESIVLLKSLYRNRRAICLSRKRLKIVKMLDIIGEKI